MNLLPSSGACQSDLSVIVVYREPVVVVLFCREASGPIQGPALSAGCALVVLAPGCSFQRFVTSLLFPATTGRSPMSGHNFQATGRPFGVDCVPTPLRGPVARQRLL